jgi:hypothetical protein
VPGARRVYACSTACQQPAAAARTASCSTTGAIGASLAGTQEHADCASDPDVKIQAVGAVTFNNAKKLIGYRRQLGAAEVVAA